MLPGIYILLFSGRSAEVRVGSLNVLPFAQGYYAYIGSALGPGGLARVSRHIRLARAQDRTPRWHVDYLLTDPRFRLIRVYCGYTTERLECPLAQALVLPVIPGFGSSDCRCAGHLFSSPADPEPQVLGAFKSLGLIPVVHHLTSPHAPDEDGSVDNV